MDELESSFREFHIAKQLYSENDVTKFISEVENCYQSTILLRIFSNKSDMYLADMTIKDEDMCIYVLGSKRNNKRERYTVNLSKRRFTCTCSDYKYRAEKLGIVCKHICFLVCKVARILSVSFIDSKTLTNDEYNMFLDVINSNILWQNESISLKSINNKFKVFNISREDTLCPICFDAINKNDSVSCPKCKNCIHEECMNVWLEANKTCVFCRSNEWTDYIIINGLTNMD